MKHLLISLTFAVLLLLPSVQTSYAQSQTPRSKASQSAGIKVTTQVKNNAEERQLRLSLLQQERVMSFSNKMIIRINATIERIKILISRIESRITKIESEGEEVLESTKENFDDAKMLLIKVELNSKQLKTDLDGLPESNDPKTEVSSIKTALNEIKDDLKEVHSLLIKVITDIKGLRVGNNLNNEE